MDDDVKNSNLHLSIAVRIGWRLASKAIIAGDDDALRRALTNHPDIMMDHFVCTSPLMDAATSGQTGAVAALIDAGVPVDARDEFDGTALIAAAWRGDIEIVRLLLTHHADPNRAAEEDGDYGDPDSSGRCALWAAICKNHHEVIEVLEPLTNLDMRERAYDAASLRGDMEFEDSLPYSKETRFLLETARRGELSLLSLAIEDGGDVNLRLKPGESHPIFGSTPLSFAAVRGRIDLVRRLLEAGADPAWKNHEGLTPADFADRNGYPEVAALFRANLAPQPSLDPAHETQLRADLIGYFDKMGDLGQKVD